MINMCFFDKSNLIYIFDSVRLYVSNGRPQFSTDLDQIWCAASLYLQMVTMGFFLQRNRATPEHQGQFLNASRRRNSSSYQPRPACGQLAAAVDERACRHSSDNNCGVKRQGLRVRAVGCASYSRGGTATGRLEAGGRPTQHSEWDKQHGVYYPPNLHR